MIVNGYALNNKSSKYVQKKLIELKEEIKKSTIIFEYFNTPALNN
jgi:hypothetical protein